MGKIMEAVFCVFYIVFTMITGILIIKNSRKNNSGSENGGREGSGGDSGDGSRVERREAREICLYGIMSLVLVCGDSFHLVPRIIVAIDRAGDYSFSLGIGKLITSITMTLFYLMMYFIFEMRYEKRNSLLRLCMTILAAARIALCLLPQNDWTGEAPVSWGIYRNIPFAVMGLIMIALYYTQRRDAAYRWMWLAITLSFVFYFPVVLWAEVSPMIGMLMLPKTCMYIWIVVMGHKQSKKFVR